MANELTGTDKLVAEHESPVEVSDRNERVIGQPQARPSEPHDGATTVRETVVHTDKVILDPNDPLAVQVPEGVGASTVDHESALATALKEGTAEEQFARRAKEAEKASSKKSSSDKSSSDQADSNKS